MDLLLISAAALTVLAAMVVLAVGVTAGRARKQEGIRSSELLGLAKLRSPSGEAFFFNDDSVLELADLLDDVNERRQRESGR